MVSFCGCHLRNYREIQMKLILPNGMTPIGSYQSIRELVARCEKRGWIKRSRSLNHQEIKHIKDRTKLIEL